MYLSTLLLVCLFVLCAARTIEKPLSLLRLDIGRVAAFSLLLILAGRFDFSPMAQIEFNLGVILMFLTGVCLSSREELFKSVMLSLMSGFVMLAVVFSGASELGLVLALSMIPFLLPCNRGMAFFVAGASPVIASIYIALMDLYLYGYAMLDMSSRMFFDAQVLSFLLAGALLIRPAVRERNELQGGLG